MKWLIFCSSIIHLFSTTEIDQQRKDVTRQKKELKSTTKNMHTFNKHHVNNVK